MACIGLEPKSYHTIKYSQPLELVLLHIIHVRINCHKGFHHPNLLNNYLFNYLNLVGLTKDFFIMDYGMSFHVMMNYFTCELYYDVICYD